MGRRKAQATATKRVQSADSEPAPATKRRTTSREKTQCKTNIPAPDVAISEVQSSQWQQPGLAGNNTDFNELVSGITSEITRSLTSHVEDAVRTRLQQLIGSQDTQGNPGLPVVGGHGPSALAGGSGAACETDVPVGLRAPWENNTLMPNQQHSTSQPNPYQLQAVNQEQTANQQLQQLTAPAAQPTSMGIQPSQVVGILPVQGNDNVFSGRMGEMPPMSAPLPLGYGVSQANKIKIWTNQFVDFYELLYPSKANTLSALGFKQSDDGTSLYLKADKSKGLHTISEWNSAFSIFMAVYLQKYPLDAQKLLKHAENVRQIAREGGNWSYYDQEFRRARQTYCISWDVFNAELAHAAHHSQKKQQQQQGAANFRQKVSPFGSTAKKPNLPTGYCWKYLLGKTCTGCARTHKCSNCQGSHALIRCPSRTQQGGSSDGSATSGSAISSPNNPPKTKAAIARKRD